MAHKQALKIIDRTLRDLRSNHILFGGAILLARDLRQTLRVIPRSTDANKCLLKDINFYGDMWNSQVNNEHASCVTKWRISRSFFKGIIRHWQRENSCWPFHWPNLVSTKFLSIHNVKRRINFESVPKYWCKLQKTCLIEWTCHVTGEK